MKPIRAHSPGQHPALSGQGLGFDEQALLVAEGGIVAIDPYPYFGNRLSGVRYQPPN
jgi:hypothetical protein